MLRGVGGGDAGHHRDLRHACVLHGGRRLRDAAGAVGGLPRARPRGCPCARRRAPGRGAEPVTNLDRAMATATRWSLVNTIVIRIGTFATGVVLARYFLGPAQWGLYAVGLVVLAVLLSANEMGVSLAMIR